MSETEQIYHIPVLLDESVSGMNIQPGGIYVDATFGGGGHSKEILSRLDSTAHLYSFDQDEDAEKNIVSVLLLCAATSAIYIIFFVIIT